MTAACVDGGAVLTPTPRSRALAALARAAAPILAASALAASALAGCSALPQPDPAPRVVGVGPLPVDGEAARRAIALYRAAHGLGAVALDPALTRVAQRQADAMARADTLSHTLAGGLGARIAAEGLRRGAEAENVSAGYPSFERAFAGWQHSPGHDANLLYRPVRRVGIAAASAPGTRFRTYWALVMTD